MDGQILADGDRWHTVFYGNGCGTTALVAVDIGHGQGDRVSSYVGTVEDGIVKADGGNRTVVIASCIDILSGNGCIAGRIKLHGQVLTQGSRWYSINNGYVGGAGGYISTRIHNGQYFWVPSYFAAIEAGLTEGNASNAAIVIAAIVYIAGGRGCVAIVVEEYGYILTNGNRVNIVLNFHEG